MFPARLLMHWNNLDAIDLKANLLSSKPVQGGMGWALSLARLWGFVVASLLLAWAFNFKSSFLPHSASLGGDGEGDGDAISHLDHIYSALHPLLMVIGFILLNGEAILVHRQLAGWSRETRKAVHLSLQAAALGFGLFGIWAKFRGNEGISANFYSLHSWIGLACVALFAFQWVVGLISLWHRPKGRWSRSAVLPWRLFVGVYAFGLAVAAAETGLQEKLTFLLGRRGLSHNSPESVLINSLGLALALLAALIILAAISNVTKSVNVKDGTNGKFHV